MRKCSVPGCENLGELRAECGREGQRRPKCTTHRQGHRKHPYRLMKGATCQRCGFVPEVPEQLDVDHIDGDHTNNDPANLQTLCANCHRLKTRLEREVLCQSSRD